MLGKQGMGNITARCRRRLGEGILLKISYGRRQSRLLMETEILYNKERLALKQEINSNFNLETCFASMLVKFNHEFAP